MSFSKELTDHPCSVNGISDALKMCKNIISA